jgi:Family of unknown function (DUF5947)
MEGSATPALASPRLQRLAQRTAEPREKPLEQCELCGQAIAPEHRHVLDLENRNLLCACRACAVLFDRNAAGGGHWRLVPERRLRLDDFELPDELWDALQIPVEMAFFFHNTSVGRVSAYYPSPMGPTESQLELDAWSQVEAANEVVQTLEADVEALLVNRARGQRRTWLVPIEDCYALVAVIRTHWRGFSGGREVWAELERFYADLDRKSKAAPAGAAERSH